MEKVVNTEEQGMWGGAGAGLAPRALRMSALGLALAAAAAWPVDFTTLDKKVLFGYQGWFDCNTAGTGSWTHWSNGVPTASNLNIDMYPDLGEFQPADLCKAGSLTIGGNRQAYLFSSQNAKVVDAHFRWMKEYGLDGVLVQRFIGETSRKRSTGDIVLKNVMAAALAHGRTFAIEYDISGGSDGSFAQTIQTDWAYIVDQLKATSHPNYLRHNGKPVVSVWGMGLNESGHPPTSAAAALNLVNWFKSGAPAGQQVTYMGGTPSRWRTLNNDARTDAAWRQVYTAMDVVQPWTIGRYSNINGVNDWRRTVIDGDLAQTRTQGNLYMPVAFPGFSWFNLKDNARQNQIPRLGGRFLWRQAYQAKAAGATMLKIAMFDEVDESTAMFKLAAKRTDAPDQGYWLTLDADGLTLPSDWYLRLAGEITRMFQGTRPVDSAMPTNPAGPVTGTALRSAPDAGPGFSFHRMEGGIHFQAPGHIGDLDISDAMGRSVRTLVLENGRSSWDGRDARGTPLPPGVYLVRLGGPNVSAGAARFARLVLP